ncbi:fumarate reductase flavoprotein subunit [Lachnospiraceae bacterium KM106-2]|nr:fumarate reductase flavoprotein subunit [Lachnospiraceae bacterium KM106-2]
MRKIKTFVALTMVTAAVALTGCSSEKAASYTDGTYTGTSDKGQHAGLKVEVTVKDSKIAEVKVTENQETEGIGSKAIDELPSKIVEKQSTDVDAVSGATKTSDAIKEAVDNALAEAK